MGDAINNLKPKAAFKAGLFTGLGIMFVIGFFILLGIVLSNKTDSDDVKEVDNGDNPTATIQVKKVDDDDDWIKGNKKAKVSIIEFSDVDCPFCTRFHDTTKEILDTYGDDINIVWRHFPIASLHPESPKKAEAIECVGELGGNDKVWEFLDKLFADGPSLAELPNVVASLGIDAGSFRTCLDSGKYTSLVQSETQEAQDAGARGTPYGVIVSGGTKIPINGALPLSALKPQLDALVK